MVVVVLDVLVEALDVGAVEPGTPLVLDVEAGLCANKPCSLG